MAKLAVARATYKEPEMSDMPVRVKPCDDRCIGTLHEGSSNIVHGPANARGAVWAMQHGATGYFVDEVSSLSDLTTTPLTKMLTRNAPMRQLTPREVQVLRLVARGLSNQKIGQELGLACDTIKTHAARIYRVLGVNTRSECVLLALRMGIID